MKLAILILMSIILISCGTDSSPQKPAYEYRGIGVPIECHPHPTEAHVTVCTTDYPES